MKKTFLLLFICVFMISCSDDSETDMQDDQTEMNDTSDNSNSNDDNTGGDTNDDNTNNANDSDGNNDDNDNGNDNNAEKLTYTKDIAPIISSNCLNCHGATPSNNAPSSFHTYDLVNNAASNMDARMNNANSPMPRSGLISQDLRGQFKQWISDGKLE